MKTERVDLFGGQYIDIPIPEIPPVPMAWAQRDQIFSTNVPDKRRVRHEKHNRQWEKYLLGFCAVALLGLGSLVVNSNVEATKSDRQPPVVSESVALSVSGCQVGPKYPESVRRWERIIEKSSATHNLPCGLIPAVILKESNGKPDAISPSGAVGLMQVMPRDGIAAGFQCVNGPCFRGRPSTKELLDPLKNVDYGSHMLEGLIARNNTVREALRAYGPMDRGYSYADLIIDTMKQYK